MSTRSHTLSFVVKHTGKVLDEVQHSDVLVTRRDGEDMMLSTARRDSAVRGGLDLSVRLLAQIMTDAELSAALLRSTEAALPWLEWLTPQDRAEFLPEFVRTAKACGDTKYYAPLARLLDEWEASAQIAHDPELRDLLTADRGEDDPVVLSRPAS